MKPVHSKRLVVYCYAIFFASGAAALILEISWSRQIGLLFGHTTHAAAVVLAGYFVGLAIGSSVGGRIARRVNPLRAYAVAAIMLDGRVSRTAPTVTGSSTVPSVKVSGSVTRCKVLAAVFGFGTFAMEVLYLRLFSLVFHNSTYTFGTVVAVFLLALALGAWLSSIMMKRMSPHVLLAGCRWLSGAK